MILNPEHNHSFNKSRLSGSHEFFEYFPELKSAYHRQLIFWESRGLMVQQNTIGGPDYVIKFMQDETVEMLDAVVEFGDGESEWLEVVKEACDVVVVGLTSAAMFTDEEWEEHGKKVVGMINDAKAISNLDDEEFGEMVEWVIKEKNYANHPSLIYAELPSNVGSKGVSYVYTETRKRFKSLRSQFPGEVFPVNLNTVLRASVKMNGSFPRKFSEDPAYVEAIQTYEDILKLREMVISGAFVME